jgi:RNA polymerase sigma-70 factor (ECF subfamily)
MSELDKLVQDCQQGELAAFTGLFRRYEARIYRLAMAILHDERDAEDAVQDACLRVFERIKHYRAESSFETWLTAVVVNVCRDRLRRRQVRHALPLDRFHGQASSGDLAETVAGQLRRQTLWSLVNRLQEKYRLPIILHYHEGLSCGEVAEVLALRTTTVYSRLNTARVQLRAMLREELEEKAERPGREYVE